MKAIKWIVYALFVLTAALYLANGAFARISGADQGPEITCAEELLEVSIRAGDAALLEGISAQDRQDGDLTDQVIVGGVSGLIGSDRAKVTYLVFDSDDNMASFTRQIRYTDYRRPRIRVSEPLVFADADEAQLLARVEVTDLLDGDLSEQARVVTLWKTHREDVYAATVVAANSRGDAASVELPVRIRKGSTAQSGVYLYRQVVYLAQGEPFDPVNYIAGDGSGIIIESDVDTERSGCYWVWYYNSSDRDVFSILTVVVE